MRPPRAPLPGTVDDPFYPESDGQPVGETDYHTAAVIWLREALKDYFARSTHIYVATQLMLYYEQGNPAARRDPDAMVVRGVSRHPRISFLASGRRRALPCVVFEIASPTTWAEDSGPRRALYARLGIAEYFQFDPQGGWLTPRLQGFRLENGVYVPLTPGSATEPLESVELGLRLLPNRGMLRLIDARTGRRIPTRNEWLRRQRRRANEAKRHADDLAAERRSHARPTRQPRSTRRSAATASLTGGCLGEEVVGLFSQDPQFLVGLLDLFGRFHILGGSGRFSNGPIPCSALRP